MNPGKTNKQKKKCTDFFCWEVATYTKWQAHASQYPAGSPKWGHLKHKEGSPDLERSKCIISKKEPHRL